MDALDSKDMLALSEVITTLQLWLEVAPTDLMGDPVMRNRILHLIQKPCLYL